VDPDDSLAAKPMREDERAVFVAAEHQLGQFSDRLIAKGLTWRSPEHQVWSDDESRYTSEISITFFRNGSVDDEFEFHIYRDGVLLVSPEQADQWFRQQLELLTQQD
jgi:hypothetical protein